MRSKRKNQHYSPEFKVLVVEPMCKENLSYQETERKFSLSQGRARAWVRARPWERIYQEGGPSALAEERRGRGATGRPRSVPTDDLLEELEYLRAENAFLKKWHALIREEERKHRQK